MSAKNIEIVRQAITKVTQILAGKKISVTQRGSEAFVRYDVRNGRATRVNIPYLPDGASQELIAATQGFLDHEVAHILFTDGSVRPKPGEGKRLDILHNICEDCFIERLMELRYKGSAKNLSTVRKLVFDIRARAALDAVPQSEKDSWEESDWFRHLSVTVFRALAGHEECIAYLNEGDKWQHIPNVLRALEFFPERIAACNNSQDTLDLARDVKEALEKINEQPPAPEPEEEPQTDPGETQKEEQETSEGTGESEDDETEGASQKGDEGEEGMSQDNEPDDADANDAEGESEADDDGAGGSEEDPDESSGAGDGDEEEGDEDADTGGTGTSEDETDEGSDGDTDDYEDSVGADEEKDDDDGEGASGSPDEDADEGTPAGEDAGDDEGEDQAQGAASDTGSDADEGEVDGQEPDDDIGDSEQETMITGTEALDALDDAVDFEQEMSANIKEVFSRDANTAQNEWLVFSNEGYEPVPYELSPAFKTEHLQKMHDEVNAMIGPMQKDIERLVLAKKRSAWEPGRKSGRLNPGALHRLSAGDPRVFRKKIEHRMKNTAVELVIDLSGSMQGDKVTIAMHCGFALAMTLERCKIPTEVFGFTTPPYGQGYSGDGQAELHASEGRIGRQYSIQSPPSHKLFKGFGQRMTSEVSSKFADMATQQRDMMGNCDPVAIEVGLRRILQRPEERKIMMVLSDGHPAYFGADDGHDRMRELIAMGERAGVETIGIGIMDDAVKQFYRKHLVLQSVSELPRAVMGEMRRILA